MSDLTLTALVTRANLESPLADLDVNDGLNFIVGRGLRVSEVVWRHTHATSPFVHGHVTVHSVKEPSNATVMIYCLGGTMAELEDNIGVLIQAFTEQHEFDLILTIDGQTMRWTCERADYEVGLTPEHIVARHVPVAFSLFRHPVPVTGVI